MMAVSHAESEIMSGSSVMNSCSMSTVQLLSPEEESELIALWPDRAETLERIWELVTKVLKRTHPAILRALPEDKEEYIAAFFDQKILAHLHKPQRLDRAASLCSWFNNFLLDQEKRKSNQYLSLDGMTDGNEGNCSLDIPSEDHSPEQKAEASLLQQHAAAFFSSLEWPDQLYLSECHCPEEGEPLSSLARRYQIASYHYRAGKLGITLKKGDLPADWESTLIGRWVRDTLGIRVSAASIRDIQDALLALCEVALMLRHRIFAGLPG